jgi:hypothetical protein
MSRETDMLEPSSQEIADWLDSLCEEYENDHSWSTMFVRELDNQLRRLLLSSNLDRNPQELERQLHEFTEGKSSQVNVFASALSHHSDRLYEALLVWEHRFSPFLNIQDMLSTDQFEGFIMYIYRTLEIPARTGSTFENLHPELANKPTPHHAGSDPGLIMKRW